MKRESGSVSTSDTSRASGTSATAPSITPTNTSMTNPVTIGPCVSSCPTISTRAAGIPSSSSASRRVCVRRRGVRLGVHAASRKYPIAAVVHHRRRPLRDDDARFTFDVDNWHQGRRSTRLGDVVDHVDARVRELRAERSDLGNREASLELGHVRPWRLARSGQVRRHNENPVATTRPPSPSSRSSARQATECASDDNTPAVAMNGPVFPRWTIVDARVLGVDRIGPGLSRAASSAAASSITWIGP